MRVGIVARKGNDQAVALAGELREALAAEGVDGLVDLATAEALSVPGSPVSGMTDCPLIVSVGGDGTFLYTARHADRTPILGVNLGEVGFLNAVGPESAVDRVREEVARIRELGHPAYREVPRVEVRGGDLPLVPGLNEVVVAGPQRGRGNGLELEVSIDGSVYTAGHADGVLVATPTGSTAYNLSEGGPLVHPDVGAMVVTSMCATDGMPPLVIGPESEVKVRASGPDQAVVASDGDRCWVETPVEVRIGLADEPVRIAGPRPEFFEALGKLD